jgi:hypothetical protein
MRQRRAKTGAVAPDEPTVEQQLYDGLEEANSMVLARSPSAPDEPTVRRCIASDELCQRSCEVEGND